MCKQWLQLQGINITAHIAQIANVIDDPFDLVDPQYANVNLNFPVLNSQRGEEMRTAILNAKTSGDSVGGIIECAVTGLPVGIGEPMFDGLESKIAQIVFGIPAIKGVEFGAGFGCAAATGSQNNDPFIVINGKIMTKTNNAGGILGGISTGMPIIFRAAVKPTPSIAKSQQTVSISKLQETTLCVNGRHDPCIVPRAVPVIEAAAAIAVYDAILCAK